MIDISPSQTLNGPLSVLLYDRQNLVHGGEHAVVVVVVAVAAAAAATLASRRRRPIAPLKAQ